VKNLRDTDYRALAEWRHALRKFLSASEAITLARRVSPTQYQLLLFVRGSWNGGPSISDLAERLQVRHQSAVGLVDRCQTAGLVRRRRDPANRRRVLVEMTRRGSTLLASLAAEHYRTIEKLGSAFVPPSLSRRPRPVRGKRRPS